MSLLSFNIFMKKIFLAFGWRSNQYPEIDKIAKSNNLTVLNLERFEKDELNEYLITQKIALPHIKKPIEYDHLTYVSWGILFEAESESIRYEDLLFLLELYLNAFLNPIFKFDSLWFEKLDYDYTDTFKDWYLDKIEVENLYKFLNAYKWIIDYSCWFRHNIHRRVENNDSESFRMFTAVSLYQQLKRYDNKKSPFFWKKEVMEIWIILETLFTKENERESIGYTLRKRIHFLLIDLIENIEDKVKEIYDTRSKFVHWSIFAELIKQYKIVDNSGEEDIKHIVTHDMFEKTKEYITILRKILILYHYLLKWIKEWEYSSYSNSWSSVSCIDIIELSMFNDDVRNKFKDNISLVRNLLSY